METTIRVRPKLILAICCMSLLIVTMDSTIVNVALPAIRLDLKVSTAGLQWVVDSYTMVIASLLMFSGSLADRVGRRRIFQVGLTIFTIASALCSIASDLHALIAGRLLQAVGGSMLNPVAMSIITNTFVDPKARARAIGVWGAVVGISMALGPLLGGGLTQTIGWRSIFWVNIPIGIAAIVLTQRFVPESKAPRPRRVDPVGQLLIMVALVSLIYAVIEGRHHGWSSPLITGLFALSASGFVALVGYEHRRREPLIDPRFFRSVPFSSATFIAITMFGAFSGFGFLNALYLQEVRGMTALQTGLYMLPLAAATMICAPISGRMVARYGALPSLVAASIATAISALLLVRIDATTSPLQLMSAYLVFGVGFGLINAPITNTAISGMPLSQAGLAAAIASTCRLGGASIGVAVAGMIATHTGAGFMDDVHTFTWLMLGCSGIVFSLAILSSTPWARATARRVAELVDQSTAVPATARGDAS